MLQSQRQEKILNFLTYNDYLELSNAVELFDASPATINRDFNDLADKKLVQRVRGGIRPLKKQDGMLPFAFRELQYSKEKEKLAQKAATMINPGDVVFVDGGTTTFHLGMSMPDLRFHIITNSLRLATLLEEKAAEQPGIEVSLTGGYLHKQSGILLGPNTRASLEQYNAHWAFISVGGITENGIFNTNELVTETERAMIRNAEKTVILADHSKIGKLALCHVANLNEIDILITNTNPDNDKKLDQYREAGITVITV
ncbi:MAG: DeoR/GlpR family DNA-binding transcription regulator [Sedimentisphaeraceae bacterium JB056]